MALRNFQFGLEKWKSQADATNQQYQFIQKIESDAKQKQDNQMKKACN